jgi:hypothetical protein
MWGISQIISEQACVRQVAFGWLQFNRTKPASFYRAIGAKKVFGPSPLAGERT